MIKSYMRGIVRNGGKGRMGLGVELFRLDAVEEEELTEEELEAAEEVEDKASTTAIMRIYEEIGEDFWTGGGVNAKKFAEELDSFGKIKNLHIHINSLGGDVFTAQAINSIISDHHSRKTTYIDGIAASAATVIACAANEVVGRVNSTYMIHHPWALAVGNAETMRKAAEDLDKVAIPIVNVYKAQVGDKIDEKKIRDLMDDETWMTADEALEYGFIDRIKGKIKAIAKVGKNQILCSGRLMDVGKYHYRNVPNYPVAAKAKVEAAVDSQTETETEPKTKEMKMTIEEIDPQLLGKIQNDAKAAERTRLDALDAMNGPGLDDIIAKAKLDGKEPKDIAMECFNVTKNQLTMATSKTILAKDVNPANMVPAGEASNRKPETSKDRISNLVVGAFKSQQQRKPAFNGN